MNEHWTEIEIQALAGVSTFEELAEVAVCIVGRMSATGKEVVQICGPMSTGGLGNLKDNMARFRLAIDRAAENGILVFDQIPFQNEIIRLCSFKEGQDKYDWEILEVFYKRIFESGYVHRALFLPGWEDSVGASWERELTTKLGLIVEDYPVEWLQDLWV